MADEKEVKNEKVETKEEKVETEKNTSAEKENATKPVAEEKETEKTEKVETEDKTETPDEVKPTEQVEEVQSSSQVSGITVEDILSMISALQAKVDAVVKENGDLKNAVANKDDELKGLRDRYETPDFGNTQKKGIVTKDKFANDSFEEYSKQFM